MVILFCSIVGSIIISCGFYTVVWAKSREEKDEKSEDRLPNSNAPLLKDYTDAQQ